MSKDILVYGWYWQNNAGDDLFIDAFKKIFPQLNFIFTDQIAPQLLQSCDAIFIGGGSFLDNPIKMTEDLFSEMKKKPVFYIGVGSETNIHPMHLELLKLAKVIAIRSSINYKLIHSINENVIIVPDIVYSLIDEIEPAPIQPNSILIIPNITVVPKQNDPHWKHSAWEFFKSEFSQFLDVLVQDGHYLRFLSFYNNELGNDSWAAIELINRMEKRSSKYLLSSPTGLKNLTKLISSYEMVITQRFHGIVLSEMCGAPYLSIYHHDKLKNSDKNLGEFISFYTLNKNVLLDKFKNSLSLNSKKTLSIERDIFERLNTLVMNALFSE